MKSKSDLKESGNTGGPYPLANNGLWEGGFPQHGQIQATYPGNAELRDVEPEQMRNVTPNGVE